MSDILGLIGGAGRGAGEVLSNPNVTYGTNPNAYIDTLIKNNPNLASNPSLAYSLTQTFKNSTDPNALAHSTLMASMVKGSGDALGTLYPPLLSENPNGKYKSPSLTDKIQNATAGVLGDVTRPLGSLIGGGMQSFMGLFEDKQTARSIGDFYRQGIGNLGPGLVNALFGVGKAAQWAGRFSTGGLTPQQLGSGVTNILKAAQTVPQLPDIYMTNLKSQANINGWGNAIGGQVGNMIGGALAGGALGDVAEGTTAYEAAAAAAAKQSADEASLIANLTAKIRSGVPVSVEEHIALEAAKKSLLSRDPLYFQKQAYDRGLGMIPKPYLNELNSYLSKGILDQQLFNERAAQSIGDSSALEAKTFTDAANAIHGEQAAQEVIQAKTLENTHNVMQSIGKALNTPVGAPIKAIWKMGKALGSRQANITYLLGYMQAQQDPQNAYIWSLAEQGKVLNADGTTQDLGIEIANTLGIDGFWGTSVRDLTDFGLKWVIDDPIASLGKLVSEVKGMYGMTGVLGKWFHGTGIFKPGDVFRAYSEYSSVRRAVDWIAEHSTSEIAARFKALQLGNEFLINLGEAKTPEAVLAVFEEASNAINIGERLFQVPTMSWYTLAKANLVGTGSKEFGTVEEALRKAQASSLDIAKLIGKDMGLDIVGRDISFVEGDLAKKAKITLGRRLIKQFGQKPMMIARGMITDRKLLVGSPSSIKPITDFLRASYMSKDFTKMVGDQLIRFGNDPILWDNIYTNSMKIAMYRRFLASGAHGDFTNFMDTMFAHVEEKMSELYGVDGGGTRMDQAFIANEDEMADRVIDPATNLPRVAGAGTTQLGERVLPNLRQMRLLGRFMAEVAQELNASGADVFLRSTGKTFEAVRQLAQVANVKVEDFLGNFNAEKMAEDFVGATEYSGEFMADGYKAKAEEVIRQLKTYLDQAGLGMTNAERYASVVKYLDTEIENARNLYVNYSRRYNELVVRGLDSPGSLERIFGTQNVNTLLMRMRGEKQMVEDLSAELKANITESHTASNALKRQADYIKSTIETSDKEARDKYVQAFLDKHDLKTERRVNLGLPGEVISRIYDKMPKRLQFQSLESYGYRHNGDVLVDLAQGFLNNWFKPLTLNSPAWSERVSISEVMLNALRIGGHNFTDAKLAQSIAKHEFYLGKVQMGEIEKKSLRFAISNIILGFEKGLSVTLKGKEFDNFLDFATNLYLETDGHLPGGVHAQGDFMPEDGFKAGVANKVIGLDGKGQLKATNRIVSDKFIKYEANHSFAGAALWENISRAHRDEIYKEVSDFYLKEIEANGYSVFLTNPEKYMKMANQMGYAQLDALGWEKTPEALKVQTEIAYNKLLREMGAARIKETGTLKQLDAAAYDHMRKFLVELPEATKARFLRSTMRSAKYPQLDPMDGWARIAVDHVNGLGTRKGELFPEIYHQISSGDIESQADIARWYNDRVKQGLNVPSHFPAHEYIDPRAAGVMNIARRASEFMHTKYLGPIVNTASRDPLFVWEAWQQYKRLQPLLEAGTFDMAQVMAQSQSEALINLAKYVHNPMDKTMWEENMRIVAPYYFAKNQAWRRALRTGGDNFGAFYKYMRLSTAVTNYVSAASQQSGIKSFKIPGAEIPIGVLLGIMGGPLALLHNLNMGGAGKGVSLEGIASSPDSVIITGSQPGLTGFVDSLLRVPFGPIVSVPAKAVYEATAIRLPQVAQLISMLLGPSAMNSSIIKDLTPNSIAWDVGGTINGFMNQEKAGSYTSAEIYTIGQMIDQEWAQALHDTTQSLIAQGKVTDKNINNSAVKQYIEQMATIKLGNKLNDTQQMSDLQVRANYATVALFVAKTLASAGTPLSMVIASNSKVQSQLTAIAKEKDAQGNFKFPNYTLQMAELLRRWPQELPDTVPHTTSPFSTYAENLGTVKFVKEHTALVGQFPYLSAFLANVSGKDASYDPSAAHLFGTLNLRQKETPQQYITAQAVANGNYMYYNILAPQFAKLYPGNAGMGMSKEGLYEWGQAGKAYAANDNYAWGQEHFGGHSQMVAVKAYDELKIFLKDPSNFNGIDPTKIGMFRWLVSQREGWEKAYRASNPADRKTLKSDWENGIATLTAMPQYAYMSSEINSIFRNLPVPF